MTTECPTHEEIAAITFDGRTFDMHEVATSLHRLFGDASIFARVAYIILGKSDKKVEEMARRDVTVTIDTLENIIEIGKRLNALTEILNTAECRLHVGLARVAVTYETLIEHQCRKTDKPNAEVDGDTTRELPDSLPSAKQ
ncbi:hypothetical protein AZL_018920 [Azospirillum sp. B510]|uniref:hypothetical protein n=1 Tax=Azospirillum sp. (strain B510) TaxID=137722 RepID=UPI0001C4C2A6|nr:hypothetical protein [Azospirillum sp. B510]BAI72530.1 hypothetical protein AZL_018920 [Azospirillum sp. B510]